MINYILRRLFWGIFTLFGISILNFGVAFLVPANPAIMIAGSHATAATIRLVEIKYGLNLPIWEQYLRYVTRFLQGNWGTSYETHQVILTALLQHFPATLLLGLFAMLFQLLLGIPVGMLSAMRHRTWIDQGLMILTLIGSSVPSFWLGVAFMYYLAYKIPLFPLGRYGHHWHIAHVILPALTVAIGGAAHYARLLRVGMIDVSHEDYVRTARAKGVPNYLVILRHISRNALLPVITVFGMDMAGLLGGLILIETVFSWPGIGYLTYQAVGNLDIPMIMGSVMFASILVVLFNILVDISYGFLDPRISYR